jgi:hypothetical protein
MKLRDLATGGLTLAILFASVPAAYGIELGRLFTTPEDRVVLEQLRQAPVERKRTVREEKKIDEPKASMPTITVNGVVIRSDGSKTAWINGMNTLEGDLASQHIKVRTREIHNDRVPIVVSGDRVEIKVGQSLDLNKPLLSAGTR